MVEQTTGISRPHLIRVLLVVVGLVFAVLFASLASNAAYAGDPGGEGSVGGGSGQAPGTGGSTPPVKTRSATVSGPVDRGNTNFRRDCDNGWSQGNSCAVGKDAVKTQNGSGYVCGDFGYNPYCDNLTGGSGSATKYNGIPATCPPGAGGKAAYAMNFNVRTTETTRTIWETDDKGVVRKIGSYVNSKRIFYTFISCVYPTDRYTYKTCYWNYNGQSWYSGSRSTIGSNGTPYRTRGSQAGDPGAPSGGSGPTAPNCAREGSAYVNFRTGITDLGYYKLQVTWTGRTYTNLQWVRDNGAVLRNSWSAGGNVPGSATNYWATSCRPGASNATEGGFNSPGAIPNRDGYLNPANCPQALWQCELGTPTTSGLDRAAVLSGALNPRSTASVMRNGEKLPLSWSDLRVIDQGNGGRTDVTNGNTGPSVRGITNISYMDAVRAGSTPFYGTNPNDANQYFKKYASMTSTSVQKWGVWQNQANSHKDEAIAFVWASDTASQPWSAERRWKVSGTFLIPKGGSIGTGGPGASEGSYWKPGTYDCRAYQGTGPGRVDKGILYGTTNPVSVVRSTNDK